MTDDPKPSDALAARTFTPLDGTDAAADQGQQQAEQAQAEAQAAQTMAFIEKGAMALMVGLLKLARARIAKQLPEILEEWPDASFQAPAEAAVPLLRRHLETLMGLMGSNVELAAFAIACLPLGLGFINAMDKHARTIDMPQGDPSPA